jgi:hypothetical protein
MQDARCKMQDTRFRLTTADWELGTGNWELLTVISVICEICGEKDLTFQDQAV